MQIDSCLFTRLSFSALAVQHMAGETTAQANYRQVEVAGIRFRLVDYEAGYIADHWCDIGHVGYIVSGRIQVDLKNGNTMPFCEGEAFLVSSFGDAPHRVRALQFARVLLLD